MAPQLDLCAKDYAWQWQKPKVEISKRTLFPAWLGNSCTLLWLG